MNNTPETDNAQFGTGRVSVDFARRLEKERDEARKDVRDLMEQYQDRESQSDSNYLWKKHEDTELIEAICTRLIEWETNQPKP
jgi:hypothetical protein